MKKIVLLFTFLLTIFTVVAAEPENFIPAQAPQVVRLNANRAVRMPWLKDLLSSADEKCREITLLLDELKKHGIESTTLFAGELWITRTAASDQAYAVLVKTALPEAKFAEFFNTQKNKNKNVELNVSTLAGHTIYISKYAPAYKAASGVPVFAVYLAKDVLAFMPLTDEANLQLTALKQGGGNKLSAALDRKSLCAFAGRAVLRKEKIRSIEAQFELSGQDQRNINFDATLVCKNAKTAMRKAMEFQFIIPSFGGLLFGNDEKLIREITDSLQIVPVNEKIVIKFSLDKSMQEKIIKYLSNPANVTQIDIPAVSVNP